MADEYKIRLRRGKLVDFQRENPLLDLGECAVVFDGIKVYLKAGNGLDKFNDLPYVTMTGGEIDLSQYLKVDMSNANPTKIREVLEGLQGGERLSYDSIKDTPDLSQYVNVDLSNLPDFDTITEGAFLTKIDGKIDESSLIETPEKIISTKTLQLPPNTLELGYNVSIHENGGFIEYDTKTLGQNYILLDYENDEILGSKKPVYYHRGVLEAQYLYQPIATTEMKGVQMIDIGMPAFDSQIQVIYFNLTKDITNLKMKAVVNDIQVADYPSGTWDNPRREGYDLTAGISRIELEPFWSALTQYDIKIHLSADQPIDMMGDGTKPYIAFDMNRITRKNIALMEDIVVTPPAKGETAYINAIDMQPIPTDKKRVYYRLDKSTSQGQTFIQNLPDEQGVKGMELDIEFVSSEDSILNLRDIQGRDVLTLRGGDKAIIFASDSGWHRFNDEDIFKGINVIGGNDLKENIKTISFDTEVTTPTDGVARIKLPNNITDLKDMLTKTYFGNAGKVVTVTQDEVGVEFQEVPKANVIKYLEATSPADLPVDYPIVYYKLSMGGNNGSVVQVIPDSKDVVGMMLVIEFLSQDSASLQLNNPDGVELTVLDKPGMYMFFANETAWAIYGKDKGMEFSDGVYVSQDTTRLNFTQGKLIGGTNGVVTLSGLANDKLGNVNSTDFDAKLKESFVFNGIADREDILPAQVEEEFKTNEYKLTSSTNISELEGNRLLLKYKSDSAMGLIQQSLPPVSDDKELLIYFDITKDAMPGTLEIIPSSTEPVNGSTSTITVNESGYVGLFTPILNTNSWMFTPPQEMHDNEISFMSNDGTKFTSKAIKTDGGFDIIDNNGATITNTTYAPSYYAHYNTEVQLVNKATDDFIISYIRPNNIKVHDRQDTTLVSGNSYLIIGRVSFQGISGASPFARLYFQNAKTGALLLDVEDRPVLRGKTYRYGDYYGFIEVAAIVHEDEDVELELVLEYGGGITLLETTIFNEGITGIVIHKLDKSKSSLGLLEYEIDSEQNILFTAHDFTKPIAQLPRPIYDVPEQKIDAGKGRRQNDGWGIDATTDVYARANGGQIEVYDGGSPITFGYGYIMPVEEVVLLKNGNIKASVKFEINQSNYVLNFAVWKGANRPNQTIMESQNGGSITLTEGWELLPTNKLILAGTLESSQTCLVPSDARYMGIFIRTSLPDSLLFKPIEFVIESVGKFIGYNLYEPNTFEEIRYKYSDTMAVAKSIFLGGNEVVYYAKTNYHFLPMGTKTKGEAPVEFVKAPWTDAYGKWDFNTNIKCLENGILGIENILKLKVNKFPTGENEVIVSMYYGKLKSGATGDSVDDYDVVPNTEQTLTVSDNQGELEFPTVEKFINVVQGDQIVLIWKSNSTSDFSVQAYDPKSTDSIVTTSIDFEKLVTERDDMIVLIDRIAELEKKLAQFEVTQNAYDTNTKLVLDNVSGGGTPSATAKDGI